MRTSLPLDTAAAFRAAVGADELLAVLFTAKWNQPSKAIDANALAAMVNVATVDVGSEEGQQLALEVGVPDDLPVYQLYKSGIKLTQLSGNAATQVEGTTRNFLMQVQRTACSRQHVRRMQRLPGDAAIHMRLPGSPHAFAAALECSLRSRRQLTGFSRPAGWTRSVVWCAKGEPSPGAGVEGVSQADVGGMSPVPVQCAGCERGAARVVPEHQSIHQICACIRRMSNAADAFDRPVLNLTAPWCNS